MKAKPTSKKPRARTERAKPRSVQRVVRRQRRCQWLTELKSLEDCGDVATHVLVDCGLCYCRLHAKVLMPHTFLEPLLPNDRTELRLPGSAATTTPKI